MTTVNSRALRLAIFYMTERMVADSDLDLSQEIITLEALLRTLEGHEKDQQRETLFN